MWMRVPTPEISSTKVIDSWSSWKATSAWKPPTWIQLKRCWWTARAAPSRPSMSAKSTAPTTKDTPASAVPSQWPDRSSLRPPVRRTAAPSSGAATSSTMRFSTSTALLQLHEAGVVDRGRMTGAEDRHDDRQTDDDLGRGDDHREEGDDLPVEVAVHPGE